jgi:hypothetical protein
VSLRLLRNTGKITFPGAISAPLAAFAFFVFSVGVPLHAHDRYEIWTIALVASDHLEIAITMSASTALQLIDPEKKARTSIPEDFATHRPRLEHAAPGLYVLTSDRKPLRARKVEVELTDENDVVFHLAYPRPGAGPVHFHASLLKKLGPGYGGILEVNDSSSNNLGWEQLAFENPNYEIVLPAPGSAKK